MNINLEALYKKIESKTLKMETIKRWFQSDASDYLKILGKYEDCLEKYIIQYFQHVQEGADAWGLNKEGEKMFNKKTGNKV